MLRIPRVRYSARNTAHSTLHIYAFSRQQPPSATRSHSFSRPIRNPIYRSFSPRARASEHMADSSLEDRAHAQAERGKRGRGRGGRGRGGGGGMSREIQVSKALSRLLRHQAGNAGIKLDEAGFAELDKVVSPHAPSHTPAVSHKRGGLSERGMLTVRRWPGNRSAASMSPSTTSRRP